jgi:hypothetical protein
VPVQPELKEYRKLALQRLLPIFAKADKVLVLDEELQAVTSWCANYEKCLRISLSTWMRRLWTLQEAVMGREKLVFQFHEQAIALSSLCEEVGVDPYLCDDRAWTALSYRIPQTELIASWTTAKLSRMVGTLQHRTTTKATDEALCIASLAGVDGKDII